MRLHSISDHSESLWLSTAKWISNSCLFSLHIFTVIIVVPALIVLILECWNCPLTLTMCLILLSLQPLHHAANIIISLKCSFGHVIPLQSLLLFHRIKPKLLSIQSLSQSTHFLSSARSQKRDFEHLGVNLRINVKFLKVWMEAKG